MSKFCPFSFPSIIQMRSPLLEEGPAKEKKEREKYKAQERWGEEERKRQRIDKITT